MGGDAADHDVPQQDIPRAVKTGIVKRQNESSEDAYCAENIISY
jgi:hypothetical protein